MGGYDWGGTSWVAFLVLAFVAFWKKWHCVVGGGLLVYVVDRIATVTEERVGYAMTIEDTNITKITKALSEFQRDYDDCLAALHRANDALRVKNNQIIGLEADRKRLADQNDELVREIGPVRPVTIREALDCIGKSVYGTSWRIHFVGPKAMIEASDGVGIGFVTIGHEQLVSAIETGGLANSIESGHHVRHYEGVAVGSQPTTDHLSESEGEYTLLSAICLEYNILVPDLIDELLRRIDDLESE